jgi:methionyl-tRNA formyltransferase
MNLIIAGKNSIAVDVLKHVLKIKNINVYVVLNKTEDFSNNLQKSLGFFARSWNIPIIDLEESYKLDQVVFISLEFDRLIKPKLFKSKQLFNVHFSKLPAYKGQYTSSWPILNGENESGVTLHLIDDGVDTGNIIDQVVFKLDIEETARSLYLKYIEKGTELLIKNLENLLKNEYSSIPQKSINSTFFSINSINYRNLGLDFNKTAFQISQQLRAFSFREYQLPKYNDFKIGNWEITNKKSSLKSGTLITENNKSFCLATIDFDIILHKDFYDDLWDYCRLNNIDKLKKLSHIIDFDLETKTIQGWNALIIATFNGAYECVEYLINQGADVNAINYNNTSVLMYAKTNAIKTRDLKIINLLLSFGADINSIDIFGKSVIDWVKEEDLELYNFFKNKI